MESKKINQLATELAPELSDLTIIGDPTTGISKKITLSQMASLFTGTVEEYASLSAFPLVGTADTIYIALDTNILYRWNTGTSAYVELSPNIVTSLVFSDANGFDGTISLVGSTATLTITTALTQGSVPFIGTSGALTQDNTNFFWDNSNKRLGINTNTPTGALDVFGSGIIGRLNGTSTNNAFLGFASAGSNKWSIGNVQSDHRFRIYNEAATSELFTVLPTGEIGIGIANPLTKLHIDGGASALIANLDANVSVAKSVSFRSDNSSRFNIEVSGTESGSNAGMDFYLRSYTDAGALLSTPLTITRATGTATFSTTIGIGTTPYAWVSTGKALQIGEFASISQQHNGGTNILSNAFESSANTYKYISTGGFATRINLDPNDGSVNFYNAAAGTAGNTITWSRKLNLTTTGVLLNYRNEGAGFAVSSAESNSSDIALGMSTGSGYAYIQSANSGTGSVLPLAFFVGATRVATMTSSGNIGIGTSTPLDTFSGRTVVTINNNGAYGAFLNFGYNGTLYGAIEQNTDILKIANYQNIPTAFFTNSTERMRITNTGKFGVGTTTTDWFFNIVNNTGGYTLNSQNTRNVSGDVNAVFTLGNNCANTSSYFIVCSMPSGDRMYVYGNGNVVNTNNSYGVLSDIKLKENIVDATPKLENLLKVKIRNYNLIGHETKQIGVVAQELEEIFPSMVEETEDFEEVEVTDEEGNFKKERISLGTTTKTVKMSVFVPMLIKAIQEQQEQIEELKAKIK